MAAVQARGFVHGAGERPELILVLGGSNDLPAALNLHLGFRKVLEIYCQESGSHRVVGSNPREGNLILQSLFSETVLVGLHILTPH